MESGQAISTLTTSLFWHRWRIMPMRLKLLQHQQQKEPLSPLLSLCPNGLWWIQMQKLKNCPSMATIPPVRMINDFNLCRHSLTITGLGINHLRR